jgi:hypothetical protein
MAPGRRFEAIARCLHKAADNAFERLELNGKIAFESNSVTQRTLPGIRT